MRNEYKIRFEQPLFITHGNVTVCKMGATILHPDSTFNASKIFTGKAFCRLEDHFNSRLGCKIAQTKAETKAYKWAKNVMDDYMKECLKMMQEINVFQSKIESVIEHNIGYLDDTCK